MYSLYLFVILINRSVTNTSINTKYEDLSINPIISYPDQNNFGFAIGVLGISNMVLNKSYIDIEVYHYQMDRGNKLIKFKTELEYNSQK